MRINTPVVLCLTAGAISNAIPTQKRASITLPTAASRDLTEAGEQLAELTSFAQITWNQTLSSNSSIEKRSTCNLSNVAVRREWGDLANAERKAYTDAVLCLQAKPNKTPASLIPGARSRFDDWIGAHINQTLTIHYTGTFLAWHRYFTWEYEQALRNECGYTGYQPYWDWSKTAVTGLESSPIFDGSEYSMSGNGEHISNRSDYVVLGDSNGVDEIIAPAGTGGGCVTSGPFKDMVVNLGPVDLVVMGNKTEANGDGLSYNPRCMKRDLTSAINKRYANATTVVDTLIQSNTADFQEILQGRPNSGELGAHGGGHFSFGGDPARDLYISPGDPLFFLHHGMVDRTWWIFQGMDLEKRTGAEGIAGTATWLNSPESANTTLDTTLNLGYAAGEDIAMRDLMSTIEGPFCYIYL
ncbi:tyrosinase-like protein orsC [Colletotrichum spaethianum]|uniref:Tyrosinase-like protein orsC n=1 Tax=Colletotrichum spaethianum TaxID=700344 RepID=A0AA37LB66_9PEZI|nr:tyrosinase-like protein orsC [Colletotrichum spaethianum]GKT43350.1 tyrosinase-like protein orsC [Colletotrichum spaethianum]